MSPVEKVILVSLGVFLLVVMEFNVPVSYKVVFFLKSRRSSSSYRSGRGSSFEDSASIVLKRLSENGTRECHNVSTTAATLLPFLGSQGEELHSGQEQLVLSTDVVHKFWIVSHDDKGQRRCSGGDFYEIDLSGSRWKSRPQIRDVGDGSYVIELKVDNQFAGNYTLKIILLFSNFHGMEHQPDPWALKKELFHLQIRFTSTSKEDPPLPLCTSRDFLSARTWSGKWTRSKFDESCELDRDGRYRCLDEDEQCDESECDGNLESLESNGWVYSAHCKFRIWNGDDAWKCLDGKKIFFWGDSNHQDTIRNLMNLVLGFNVSFIDRVFVSNITNPSNPSQNFSIVSIFNGHTSPNQNLVGLGSLFVKFYRKFVEREFFRDRTPDAVIINSGIHDAYRWEKVADFAKAANFAAEFWRSLLGRSRSKARVVIRNTITVAGHRRGDPANPQKMEAFNSILSNEFHRKLQETINHLMFVDNYDITFPWHYDHCCSDGGHYGMRPHSGPWFERVGHFYFVDVMLVHILLTAICS